MLRNERKETSALDETVNKRGGGCQRSTVRLTITHRSFKEL